MFEFPSIIALLKQLSERKLKMDLIEYLRKCTYLYRTEAQQKFVEETIKQIEMVAKKGGDEITLIPHSRAYHFLEYGAKENEAFREHDSDESAWIIIHHSYFDRDELQKAFESHGFRVSYNEHGNMEVDWR